MGTLVAYSETKPNISKKRNPRKIKVKFWNTEQYALELTMSYFIS